MASVCDGSILKMEKATGQVIVLWVWSEGVEPVLVCCTGTEDQDSGGMSACFLRRRCCVAHPEVHGGGVPGSMQSVPFWFVPRGDAVADVMMEAANIHQEQQSSMLRLRFLSV